MIVKRAVNIFITVYQRMFSPFLGQNCRFYPSCSEYARELFEKHPLTRALLLSLKRVMRCHNFSAGGFDPPPR